MSFFSVTGWGIDLDYSDIEWFALETNRYHSVIFEIASRSRKDPMPKRRQPRAITPRPRSGAAAKSARLLRCRNSREELPNDRGQGWQLRGATPPPRSSGCAGTGGPRGAIPLSRSEGVAVRRYPSSKVRSIGCALLEQP